MFRIIIIHKWPNHRGHIKSVIMNSLYPATSLRSLCCFLKKPKPYKTHPPFQGQKHLPDFLNGVGILFCIFPPVAPGPLTQTTESSEEEGNYKLINFKSILMIIKQFFCVSQCHDFRVTYLGPTRERNNSWVSCWNMGIPHLFLALIIHKALSGKPATSPKMNMVSPGPQTM